MRLTNCSPRISLSLKASLDPSACVHIDLALKRLKLVARRLAVTLTTFQEEYWLLERICYKGKNQHRISLFWRRVEEIRRLCSRIMGVNLTASINQIRHSFYNSKDYDDASVLKSSWTHLPDVNALALTMRNFDPVRLLLMKLIGAYCSFKRVMQTGAFLQLILTLSALVCRLHALTQVLLEIHEELISALAKLCSSLKVFPNLYRPSDEVVQEADVIPVIPPISPAPTLAQGKEMTREGSTRSAHPKDRARAQGETQDQLALGTEHEKKTSGPASRAAVSAILTSKPKVKRRKKSTDEIDTIFGV